MKYGTLGMCLFKFLLFCIRMEVFLLNELVYNVAFSFAISVLVPQIAYKNAINATIVGVVDQSLQHNCCCWSKCCVS
jgi:hypothetical protein